MDREINATHGVVALAAVAVMDTVMLKVVVDPAAVAVEFCPELEAIIQAFILQIVAKTGQVIVMGILGPQVTLHQVVQGVVLETLVTAQE